MDDELQRRTLRLYGELLARSDSWAGKLVLSAGAGCSLSGLGAATAIAGGCSCLLEADRSAARSALRNGGVDFVVSTVDEALRVLKNELRQRRPLAVALIARPDEALVELKERGVSAQLGVGDSILPAFERLPSVDTSSPELLAWLSQRGWSEVCIPLEQISALDEGDPRLPWLQRIAAYQRSISKGARWLWMSAEELSLINVNAFR